MRRHDLAENFRRYASKRTIKSDLGRPGRTDSAYADRFCPQDLLPRALAGSILAKRRAIDRHQRRDEPQPNSVLRLMCLTSGRSPEADAVVPCIAVSLRSRRIASARGGGRGRLQLAHAVRLRLLRISLYNLCACRCPYVHLH